MDYATPAMLVREVDGITVIRLRGPNLNNNMELGHISAEIDSLIANGVQRLVLDLKHVEFAGSAALGLLIRVQKHMAAAGGKLVLSHSQAIDQLLKISQTASLFTLAPDLSAARKLA